MRVSCCMPCARCFGLPGAFICARVSPQPMLCACMQGTLVHQLPLFSVPVLTRNWCATRLCVCIARRRYPAAQQKSCTATKKKMGAWPALTAWGRGLGLLLLSALFVCCSSELSEIVHICLTAPGLGSPTYYGRGSRAGVSCVAIRGSADRRLTAPAWLCVLVMSTHGAVSAGCAPPSRGVAPLLRGTNSM